MKEFIIATNNAHKVVEIERILSPLGITAVTAGERGIDLGNVVEDGDSFAANAYIKAKHAFDLCHSPVIADDSGLCVDALDGAPGTLSARWAGVHGDDAANNQKLLAQMEDVPDGERSARFHSTVVLVERGEAGERILAGNGDCEGSIARDLRGTGGFGYDPLFELADVPGTRMAELTPEQKNALSHRRRALDDLATKL